MTLSTVLAGSQSNRSLEAIGRRHHLTSEQMQHAMSLVRHVVLLQLDACLQSENGRTSLLQAMASPAVVQIEAHPESITDQSIRLAGDAIHRKFMRQDTETWNTWEQIARHVGVSHQSLHAMVPLLTLLILSAIRTKTAPSFRRLLMQYQPDDSGSDPFAFAARQADGRASVPAKPASALRWLELVLERAQDEQPRLIADPNERIG